MTARFCPQCGINTLPEARFCAACGTSLPGSGQAIRTQTTTPAPAPSWRTQLPGLTVLTSYLLIGSLLWFGVLRTQPFPMVNGSSTEGPPTGGPQELPKDHPPMQIPEEVRTKITEFANKAKEQPKDLSTWKSLAEMQFRASQIEASYRSAALESFKHVLALAPTDTDALRGVGNIYYDFEEHAKAIDYYKRYLEQKPDDSGVRTDLGTMYLYSKNIDQAVSEYQTVIAKEPGFFQAYFNLGVAYNEKGQKDKSVEALNKAKSLTPDQNVRTRIDQFLTQISAPVSPSVAQGTSPATPPAPTAQVKVDPSLSPFQQSVEQVLRSANIMGERINRIEWSSPTEARVLLQNFPMSGMPPQVRAGLIGKLQTKILEAKEAAKISEAAKIELIDLDSQQVMETLNS